MTDLSGNGNNGISYGGLTLGGEIDNIDQASGATLLDGVNDYVSVGTSSVFNLTNSGALSAWIKFRSGNDYYP